MTIHSSSTSIAYEQCFCLTQATERLSACARSTCRTSIADPKPQVWEVADEQDVGMLSTPWMEGHGENFWNFGHVFPDESVGRSVDSFWTERFLQYQDNPTSGPIGKPDGKDTPDKPRKLTVEDDRNARVVTEGMQEHWYPYGGGTKMCPVGSLPRKS